MKTYKLIGVALVAAFVILGTGCSKTPVAKHGRLSLEGTQLVDSHGEPVQLRGFSTQHIAKSEMFVTPRYLKELREDFASNVIRVAMYTNRRDYGYLMSPELKDVVKRVVKDATDAGLYAIIDWHILADRNPMDHLEESKAFFDEMSKSSLRIKTSSMNCATNRTATMLPGLKTSSPMPRK